ncbi:MAG: hypothetical protein VX599_07415 [Pseudomonadota bacterium]|nr:hypothetical protein [Pseudomonadota bacterium]
MPFYDRFIAVLSVGIALALPAFADGTPGKPVNRGPAPVQAHKMVPPEPGCYIIEDELGQAWSCPARKTVAPHPAPVIKKTTSSKPCCGTVTRTIVKEHPPVVTKRIVTHRKAPTRTVTRTETRHPVRTVQRVETRAVQLDMGSFTGGVGAGVGGDFYGGGGAVIISSGRSYSGVMSHTASSYTFRSHRGYRGGGKKRRGGGGCGC